MVIFRRFFILLLIILLCVFPVAAAELIPGGQVIGLRLEDGTVQVAGFDPNVGSNVQKSGLQVGDRIAMVDGTKVETPEEIRQAVERCDGPVELTVLRAGKTKKLRLQPVKTAEGQRLGVYLRQGISGLGTVTYYQKDGSFGALGHGVMDGSRPVEFETGTVCGVQLLSVRKGESGKPGQLLGALLETTLGDATKNTPQGIFGTLPLPAQSAMETGEARVGDAVIRCTLDDDGVQEYSVQILKCYPQSKDRCRNLLLKVTDKRLLEQTGGIVQGMSGSPIIQDGKLVGAVTHVLVNDPTTGYGIFIKNMLDAAA